MHSWHGVVLAVYHSQTDLVLKVQTVRNVFRKLPPQLIELNTPGADIALASLADLEAEVEQHRQMQERSLAALVEATTIKTPS